MRMADVIAPSFYKLHWDVLDEKHTHYWLKGGRGSTKSTFVSVEIILGMMQNPYANAIAIRKVAEYLKQNADKVTVKSKSAQKDSIELTYEVTLKNNDTDFITKLSEMNGVGSAVLVSYNGDYMG